MSVCNDEEICIIPPFSSRRRLLRNLKQRVPLDGLTTLDYQLESYKERHLYTVIKVQLDRDHVMMSFFNRALDNNYERWFWLIDIARRFGIHIEERKDMTSPPAPSKV